MTFRLDVYEGVGKVRPVELAEGQPVTIGRTQSNDVVVTGAGVSRHHCTVVLKNGIVRLENKSSTKTGTRVNGEKVKDSIALDAGDEITIGETVMVLSASAGAAPAETKKAEPKRKPAKEEPPSESDEEQPSESDEEPPSESDEEPPSESDEESVDEEGSARDAAREFVERKRMERLYKLIVGIAILAVGSGGVAYVGAKLFLNKKPDPKPAPGSPGEWTPPPVDGGLTPAELGNPTSADEAWHRVQMLDSDAIAAGLEAFHEQFEDDRRADDALFFSKQLRAARQDAGSQRLDGIVGVMLSEARRLERAHEPSRAQAVCEIIEALVPSSAPARQAGALKRGLREAAKQGVKELHDEAQALAARLGPVQAILLVLEQQNKLRGLGQDAELDDLVAELERQAAEAMQARTQPRVQLSVDALTVEKLALDTALQFDFKTSWEHLDNLLTLALSDEGRLRAHWLRHQIRGLQRLFQATLKDAKRSDVDKRPTLTVGGALRARLVKADAKHVVLAPVVKEGEGELKWRWGRVTPYQVQELFTHVEVKEFDLARAKAFHAFNTGLDPLGVQHLLPFTNHRRLKSELFSFYALVSGVPMPEGGFLVFEGRFVSPAEKDRILAARREARELAKQLAMEAREEKNKRKLQKVLAKVLALMDEGHYQSGRQALAKIAKRHADVEGVGDVALARLNSPVLRRRDMRLSRQKGRNGPSSNRLDIYFMGDGYVLDDRKQVSFDRDADNAWKSCELQDFFKEYDQYINYWAVNLASKEEGLTKDGTTKDTALQTEINGGVYTVGQRGRANMFRLLDTWYPDENDHQAVSVGNDFATVATGGGGTVAVAKTMLTVTPHELGHSYGGLGDEYDQEPGPNPGPPQPYSGPERVVAPNIIAGLNKAKLREMAPWKEWIDPTGTATWNWTGKPIDIFEGANRQPRGYWRPQRACVMRDVGQPFCAVCMEIMVKRLYRYVKPIDEVWPKETELTAGRETITLRVLVMRPATHPLWVHWRRKTIEAGTPEENADAPEPEDPGGTRQREKEKIDPEKTTKNISGKLQVIEGNYVHYIKIRPRDIKEPGRYEFSAEVWDDTPWVRNSKQLLNQTHKWIVTVPPR